MIDVLEAIRNENRSQVEAYCEGRAKSVYLGRNHVLCRVLGDWFMVVDGRDTSVAPHLALSGYWEYPITKAIARYVKPGMRCIDVGANFGYFTVLLGHLVGEDGAVQAWEPLSSPCAALERSLSLNALTGRVDLLQRAASDADGTATIEIPGHLWGSARLVSPEVRRGATPEAVSSTTVYLRRLDSTAWGDQPVDFVKIDAEGHEPRVWRGMEGILGRNPNLVVLMEYAPAFYEEPPALLGQVQEAGFKLQRVTTEGLVEPISEAELLACPSFEMLWLKR